MIIFSLPNEHPLVLQLGKLLVWLRQSDTRISGQGGGELDKEALYRMQRGEDKGSCRIHRFQIPPKLQDIDHLSEKLYREKTDDHNSTSIPVAKTWYPPKEGYLGWHIDPPGNRLYSTWADGKSFFRYEDPETKEIVTSWDGPQKWTFRIFSFDEENPMWHCVGAEDLRVSVGYKFICPR